MRSHKQAQWFTVDGRSTVVPTAVAVLKEISNAAPAVISLGQWYSRLTINSVVASEAFAMQCWESDSIRRNKIMLIGNN